MAYAQTFDNDIFISYAHADNRDQLSEGWITLFRLCLEVRLQELTGRHKGEQAVAIWRDPALEGNEQFAEVLTDQVRKAALLVSVISPSYVNSPWCQREIETFCGAARERLGLVVGASKARVIKVVKDYVPRDRHPEPLQTQIGYEFYRMDTERKRPRQFTLLRGDDTTAVAKQVIDDLAHGILETLDAINETVKQPVPQLKQVALPHTPAAAPAAAADGRCVYLAECHFELDDVRRQIRRELADRGVTVLPAGDLPVRSPQDFAAAVKADLERCRLSIHLVGARRGLVVPGCADDIVGLQDQFAAERATALAAEGRADDFRRLLWVPPDTVVPADEPAQQAFVEMIERAPRAAAATELVRAPLHALMDQVHVVFDRRAPPAPPADAGGAPTVYVVSHLQDAALAAEVADHLFERGFTAQEPVREGEEDERARLHREQLENSDAVLVIAGGANDAWLQTQVGEVMKSVAWRGGRPFKALGTYFAPPSPPTRRLRVQGWQRLDGSGGLAAAALDTFTAALKPAATGGV